MTELIVTLLLIAVLLNIVRIVSMIRMSKQQGDAYTGEGWWDIQLSENVRMRFYNPDKYWQAHELIDENYILQEGTFKYDGICWVRYSPTMTKREYEDFMYKTAKLCNNGEDKGICPPCVEIINKYEKQYGVPEHEVVH